MKTIEEIAELKSQWESDPCWDIEDTEGFEAHQAELKAYHEQKREEWQEERLEKIRRKAFELGCPDNSMLAMYVMKLERRIEKLEAGDE